MTATHAIVDYVGCTCIVEASEPPDLEWLIEFLQPDFSRRENDDGRHKTYRIVMRRDAGLYGELLSRGPHPSGASMPCFALDGRWESLPRWSADGGDPRELIVFDEAVGAFTRHVDAKGLVQIVAQPGRGSARVALLRAVRELTTKCSVGRGAALLHAAALAWKGKGVVIAGPKGAGKTTLLLHLLSAGTGARFLANDRVTIRMAADTLEVGGMPTIVHVRGASLDWLPHLEGRLRGSHDHHRLTLSEVDRRHTAYERVETMNGASDRASWSLSPAQLARLLGIARSPSVPLAAVVFPQQTGRDDGLSLERLSRGEAERCVSEAVFTSGGPPPTASLFGSPSTYGAGSDVTRTLASTLPCFRCSLGTAAYAGPDAWARFAALLMSDD
ncbi:MAG: hypothetical protein AB7J63_00940 [Vicinamibacterales bacterium]